MILSLFRTIVNDWKWVVATSRGRKLESRTSLYDKITSLINTAVCWSDFFCFLFFFWYFERNYIMKKNKIPSSPIKPEVNKASTCVSFTWSMNLQDMQQQNTFTFFCFLYVFPTRAMEKKNEICSLLHFIIFPQSAASYLAIMFLATARLCFLYFIL